MTLQSLHEVGNSIIYMIIKMMMIRIKISQLKKTMLP